MAVASATFVSHLPLLATWTSTPLAPLQSSSASSSSTGGRWKKTQRLGLEQGQRFAGSSCSLLVSALCSIGAAGLASSRTRRTRLYGGIAPWDKRKRDRKRPTSKGPRRLLSGYSLEDDELDDGIDIYAFIGEEDFFEDYPPAPIKEVTEVAAFTVYPNSTPEASNVPEYRTPPIKAELSKGIRPRAPVDQSPEKSFTADIRQDLKDFGPEDFSLEDIDIITSFECLRMLVNYADGIFTEDMRSKGMNTHRGVEPEDLDICRVGRLPEAPNAITIGSVWSWNPAEMREGGGTTNRRGYDVNFQCLCQGEEITQGGNFFESRAPEHFRLLKYKMGDLNMLVKVPIAATVPRMDDDAMDHPGMGVQCSTPNMITQGRLWGSTLRTTFAEMQIKDTGMLSRGIMFRTALLEIQELTRDDLRLDRPTLQEEADKLLGKTAVILKRIKEVAECPGAKDRVLYVQYYDTELRLLSPRLLSDDMDINDIPTPTNREIADMLGLAWPETKNEEKKRKRLEAKKQLLLTSASGTDGGSEDDDKEEDDKEDPDAWPPPRPPRV